ncbi:sulfotransferase family protein [Candidatus Neptunochlamydia vexilliferae]|uniref:sulfotransferase family protein n=1 Tax=Candidatus Neptunichlamydia vexilliferae TaxID=1651774 RepID=UPI001891DAB2|nr:sulfotransferase [Candidatus Neptunochlamydia vexilliferae]
MYDPLSAHEPKQLIVVLGMHRSGTSLVTKGLETLGVDLGTQLLPGQEDNPQGYFEDTDIGAFNETVLYLLKLSCDSIKNYPEHIPNRKILIEYGVDLIQKKMEKKQLFGFKDPRTARNMSLWKDIFAACPELNVQYVCIVRNPMSVTQSLLKRNGIDPTRSYYLWLQYYVSALSEVDPIFISYEELMRNPEDQVKRLGEKLGLGLGENGEDRVRSFANQYVTPSFQHHLYSLEDLNQERDLPNQVAMLYQELLKVCLDEAEDQRALSLAHQIGQDLMNMGSLFKMIDQKCQIGETRKYRFFDLLEDLICCYNEM